MVSEKFNKIDGISYLSQTLSDEEIEYGIEPIGMPSKNFVKYNPIASEVMKYGVKLEI